LYYSVQLFYDSVLFEMSGIKITEMLSEKRKVLYVIDGFEFRFHKKTPQIILTGIVVHQLNVLVSQK